MMGTRMLYWRSYVYVHSLYSLPSFSTGSYREWGPRVYRRKSRALFRIMEWVKRDLPVLVNNKMDMQRVFYIIQELLPRVSMKSMEFKNALVGYLGGKTLQFIHGLINYARSPYDDIISYECNVHYRPSEEEEELPMTSSEAKAIIQMFPKGLLNYVDFSRYLNENEDEDAPDCCGHMAEMEPEDEEGEQMSDPVDKVEVDEDNLPLQLSLQEPPPEIFSNEQPGQQPQSNGVSVDELQLEMAIERSILDNQTVSYYPDGSAVIVSRPPAVAAMAAPPPPPPGRPGYVPGRVRRRRKTICGPRHQFIPH